MIARAPVILDTGVIIAGINVQDPHHERCRDVLAAGGYEFVIPVLCVAEVAHLVLRDLGPHVEASFVDALRDMAVESPNHQDWVRIGQLVRQYVDFPLGTVDASVIALAERLNTPLIATLDHRHFRAIRPGHVPSFTLLP